MPNAHLRCQLLLSSSANQSPVPRIQNTLVTETIPSSQSKRDQVLGMVDTVPMLLTNCRVVTKLTLLVEKEGVGTTGCCWRHSEVVSSLWCALDTYCAVPRLLWCTVMYILWCTRCGVPGTALWCTWVTAPP